MAANLDRLSDIPRFTDKPGEFPIWWELFQEYGEVRGFGDTLKHTPEGDLPMNPRAGNLAQEQADAIKRNIRAKSALKMALLKKLVITVTTAGKNQMNNEDVLRRMKD